MLRGWSLHPLFWHCTGGGFENKIGSKGTQDPEQLHYALWTATQLLSGASSKSSKRVLIFTRDDNPIAEAANFRCACAFLIQSQYCCHQLGPGDRFESQVEAHLDEGLGSGMPVHLVASSCKWLC